MGTSNINSSFVTSALNLAFLEQLHVKKEFVPTHKLKYDIPQLNLKKGTLLRQINPFAEKDDILKCLEEGDRSPWLLYENDLEPLTVS